MSKIRSPATREMSSKEKERDDSENEDDSELSSEVCKSMSSTINLTTLVGGKVLGLASKKCA